jgi:hypothetical protein
MKPCLGAKDGNRHVRIRGSSDHGGIEPMKGNEVGIVKTFSAFIPFRDLTRACFLCFDKGNGDSIQAPKSANMPLTDGARADDEYTNRR